MSQGRPPALQQVWGKVGCGKLRTQPTLQHWQVTGPLMVSDGPAKESSDVLLGTIKAETTTNIW